ncbi:spore germination protein KB [Cytobacillus eiseniae]|uniref:Spore germination protein KB n=1 Tax=Cytobacillus eiseniae TaxID=762947 RepID=A0ABS4RBQ9_9BACI|nr:endospore germination permease [Cytobacillus eiseniae]MBP2240342.1 spore germination protein KB [Cytobacillus eiseniae]
MTMIEKGQISSLQIEFMMVPTIIATGILSIPSIAGKYAQHDMWMTPIVGSLIGFITVYITWKLYQLYPKLTPIQYSEIILGKAVGKIFSLFLVSFYIHNTGLIIRQYTDFITGNVMFETPGVFFSISIMFVSALAVRGGIEVIARTAVICTTLYLITSLSLLLLIKDIDVTYMLPIFENGLLPVIKGGFVHTAWFSEFFLLSFLFPFVNSKNTGLKSGMKASLYVMLILLYVNFFVLTLLADSSANQFYPVYSIVGAISVLGFFENFEAIITASWILGNYVKVSVFLYVASLGLAQLLRLSDYRSIVFPLSLLLIFFSYWDIPNIVILADYMTKIQPFYFVFVQTILPLFLLLIALARLKRSESS